MSPEKGQRPGEGAVVDLRGDATPQGYDLAPTSDASHDAEILVLAIFLTAKMCRRHAHEHIKLLEPEDFEHPTFRVVFLAMQEAFQETGRVEFLTVREKLLRRYELSGMRVLPGLTEVQVDPLSISSLVRKVKAAAKRRREEVAS